MKKIRKLKIEWLWSSSEEKFYSNLCIGKTLHVCCGKSKLGDVRVDIKPQDKDVRFMDYRNLEFPDLSFDTVICDPPWAKTEAVDKGLKWLHELSRVARKKIIIIHHHFFTIKNFKLTEAYCVRYRGILWKVCGVYNRTVFPMDTSLINKLERLKEKYGSFEGNISWETLRKEGFDFSDKEKLRLKHIAPNDLMTVATPYGISFHPEFCGKEKPK